MDEEIPWLSYIIVALIVSFITAVLTEHSVLKRIQYSEGIALIGGKCRLKRGYGRLDNQDTNQ